LLKAKNFEFTTFPKVLNALERTLAVEFIEPHQFNEKENVLKLVISA
jgi:hypothetical protein